MKMRFRIRILCLLLTLSLGLALPCLAVTSAPTEKTVRVGFYEYPPFQHVAPDGTLSGYSYDYLQAVSQYTGWQYEFVTTASNLECLELLRTGEIDLMGTLLKTPEREAIYNFPETPSGWSMSYLVTQEQRGSYAFEDFDAFDGMTVAVQSGAARLAGLLHYCAKNGFSVQTLEVADDDAQSSALAQGKADAALISSNQLQPNHRIIAKFDYSNVYYATNRQRPELVNELDSAIAQLLSNNPEFVSTLYSKYYVGDHIPQVVFSQEELAYIRSHPTVKVFLEPNWLPIEGIGADGVEDGIAIALLRRISYISGLSFTFLPSDNYADSLLRFRVGEGDILASMCFDYNWANRNNAFLTSPYLTAPIVSISRANDDVRRTVALPKSYYMTERIRRENPNVSILYLDSVRDCVNAVYRGSADYTLVGSYEANYYLSIPQYRSLMTRTLLSETQQLSFAVCQDADPMLYSILSKSLQGISEQSISDLVYEHVISQNNNSFFTMFYTNPSQFALICLLLLLLAAGILLALVFSHTLKRKNVALEEALHTKSDFLSRMSHDMRTPMNAILGLSHLGQTSTSLEESTSYHERVHNSADYLLGLINDTLDMSKFDSGKMVLHPEPYRSSAFVSLLDTLFRQKAAEKQILFSIDIQAEEDYVALLDPLRMQQIFVNLINNAIKFTPPGGRVTFRLSVTPLHAGELLLAFTIQDTGIGISPAFQTRMFEPFEQEYHHGTLSEESGTGLGLSIVKRLVDLMHGTLSCHSTPGEGTEFQITIPATRAPLQSASTPAHSPTRYDHSLLRGKRLLLCEDHPLNTQIATKLLEQQGMLVEAAGNGQLGLERFLEAPVGYYDAILMDIRMPVLNGLETSRRMRALDRADAKTIPILAMTANAFEENREQSFQAGMTAHLAKPIVPKELYDTLCALLSQQLH